MRWSWVLPLLSLLAVRPAAAQAWDDPATLAVVRQARARRAADQAAGLRDFRARAHGFVFFLAQLGAEGLEEPPQLVKSDELMLEVYWQAPGRSKQRIVGWRDRADLPTDIAYHRDHLGIVQNGFADRIRLGDGDEVRDVPHPLAADAEALYHFALVDSTTLRLPGREIRVMEVAFRPREPDRPRIVGSMYLDRSGGELVRLRFTFTRAAYLDATLEDITIVLEQGLWDGRWWLPRRQEIEIRRGTTWLDMPARGIIRGRWEIDDYAFNVGLPDSLFRGLEIVDAPQAQRDTFPWDRPLDRVIAEWAGPQSVLELREARERARDLVRRHAMSGLPVARPAIGGMSDLAHVNRVEGLAVGFGYRWRPAGGPLTLRARAGFGFGDERPKAELSARFAPGGHAVELTLRRAMDDVLGGPPIAPVLNSLLAQEAGRDYGDWVLVTEARLTAETRVWTGGRLVAAVGWRESESVAVRAASARGTYRANASLGAGSGPLGDITLRHARGVPTGRSLTRVDVRVGGGRAAGRGYARGTVALALARPAGPGAALFDGLVGWGSAGLPADQSFAVGGRGTLPGEPHRAFGGRAVAYGRLAWRVPLAFPAIPLGPFASTGPTIALSPFLAAGWAAEPVPGAPWQASDGVRPVVGVAVEWFHRLIRVEMGVATRTGTVGVTVDLRRSLWPVL
jgi:hypothetical protein